MKQASFDKTIQFFDQCLANATEFVGIDLSDSVLDRFILSQQCNFEGASFAEASLVGALMPRCCFKSANFQQADLTDANFEGADFRGADLRNATLKETQLNDALYDFSTRFDNGVAPTNLGMKTPATIKSSGQRSQTTASSSVEKASSPGGAPLEDQPLPQKNKEMQYRGNKLAAEMDDSPERTEEKPQYKEIWYRGSRTLVEVKRADSIDKDGLNYRGVRG